MVSRRWASGLSVTGGISALLPRTVGLVRAKELLFLGEHLSADEAHRLRLVNRVVPNGSHEQAALEMAGWPRSPGRPGLAEVTARPRHGLSVPDAFEREVDAAIATMATDEAQVGAEAFRERSGE